MLLLAIETTNSFNYRHISVPGVGSLPDDICKGPHGDVGEPGEKGEPGYSGVPGEKGRRVFPRMEAPLTAPCYCPGGEKGEKGIFSKVAYRRGIQTKLGGDFFTTIPHSTESQIIYDFLSCISSFPLK